MPVWRRGNARTCNAKIAWSVRVLLICDGYVLHVDENLENLMVSSKSDAVGTTLFFKADLTTNLRLFCNGGDIGVSFPMFLGYARLDKKN